jgi:hypothetical protein
MLRATGAPSSRWDAGCDPALGESIPKGATVIALVGNKRLGVWQYGMDQSRAPMVTHLSLGEKKDDWPANAIADRVQLGVQPAYRAADATG